MSYSDFLKDHRESHWQKYWRDNRTFVAEKRSTKPKYYVLDMFPYPSGAGLHVGHPLGYIATDIVARFKWLKGFNVLHPMGFDAFGLPAEQYAIETGTHPAVTTEANIKRFKEQLDVMGMAYDPEAELKTCDPSYYKWTQWIFLQMFNSWYNRDSGKAEAIETLIEAFGKDGNLRVNAATSLEDRFSAAEWNAFTEAKKHSTLLHYRLCYITEGMVNWCPALGTVLANDEVIDGKSERGGHPVFRVPMRQWVQRMTAYADRLLEGLDRIDWPESLKEMQRNWIGRSEGAKVFFPLENREDALEIFTTRPDTIFGATFMVVAPEHEIVASLTTPDRKAEVEDYIRVTQLKSEVDRMAEVKTVSGAFTGSYAVHPFTRERIPVWIADYVLAGYGTGAIMAVPAHDARDYRFAKHFGLPITEVVSGGDITVDSYDAKEGILVNSGFLNGLQVKDAMKRCIEEIVKQGLGEGKVNYRLRDPNFSRQRYWGEPFPIVYRDGVPYALGEKDLPVTLPDVQSYLPSGDGESPLANVKSWTEMQDGSHRETHTMPGYAGSSWYFLRYPDAHNEKEFVASDIEKYWMNVDLYIGGSEHAVGHLLYSRFWTKFLRDRGFVSVDEPFKKLVNQGMIQGRSSLVYRIEGTNSYVSSGLKDLYPTQAIHVDVNLVSNDVLDVEALRKWKSDFADAEFILEEGKYICGHEIEKMSKRWHNVVNPDDICAKYGADTFRLYEMFLGPLEISKPFITNGIEGVSRFMRKAWALFENDKGEWRVNEDAPTPEELKILHSTIRKTGEDIERLSFNTSVSQFMICVNGLQDLKCHKRSILEPFLIILSPFAPHFAEEMWSRLGNKESVCRASWPEWKQEYLTEKSFDYPVSINGKVRAKMTLPLDLTKEQIETEVMKWEELQKFTNGNPLKKLIVVPGRIINVVV